MMTVATEAWHAVRANATAVPARLMTGSGDSTRSKGEIDRATLARCREQDAAAFRVFVTNYQHAVFTLLARVVGRASVDDLAQETFLRAFRAFPRFDLDAPTRPSTWLLTIAVR